MMTLALWTLKRLLRVARATKVPSASRWAKGIIYALPANKEGQSPEEIIGHRYRGALPHAAVYVRGTEHVRGRHKIANTAHLCALLCLFAWVAHAAKWHAVGFCGHTRIRAARIDAGLVLKDRLPSRRHPGS